MNISGARIAVGCGLLVGLLLSAPRRADAKHIRVDIEEVPIERAIDNLEYQLKTTSDPPKVADLEFHIGRLYSMRYALDTSQVDVVKKSGMPFNHYSGEYPPYETRPRIDSRRKEYLREAIRHLRRASELDPSSLKTRLGFAWCVDQSGDKHEAKRLYRSIVTEFHGDSFAASEVAGYLIPLLDAKKDAAEIADLQGKIDAVKRRRRAITPLVIPLSDQTSEARLLSDRSVPFDLDGFGARAFGPWPSARAGWLVWDPKRTGKIDSGLKLFGSVTFWLFWDNGYQALSVLDDNHDGKIEGKELDGLAIWQDLNGDGVAQPGEVRPVSEWGIKSISCAARQNADGQWYSPAGVAFDNGDVRPTYDLILNAEPATLTASGYR